MKAIIIKDKLHMLENLKTIEIYTPDECTYYLVFYYLGESHPEKSSKLNFNEAQTWLEKILENISKST